MHAIQDTNGLSNAGLSDADAAAERGAAGFLYGFGGAVLGAVTIMLNAVLDGVLVAFTQRIFAVDVCGEGFSLAVVAVLMALAVAITVGLGAQLFRWGAWIGRNAAAEDAEYAAYLRRRFRFGALIVFCVLSPATWLVMLAASNCAGN